MDANLEHDDGGAPAEGPVRFEKTGVVWEPGFPGGRSAAAGGPEEAEDPLHRFLAGYARWSELNARREFEYRCALAGRSARSTRIGLVLLMGLIFLPVIVILLVCYPDMAP